MIDCWSGREKYFHFLEQELLELQRELFLVFLEAKFKNLVLNLKTP